MADPSVAQLPVLDLVAIAKTTRKSLDRLASFSNIRSSTNEPQQVQILSKVSSKIVNFIQLIDSSILSAQCGYQLASDAMIVCDPEETEWDTDVNIESLKAVCNRGEELAKEVADGFREIKQEVYKIAASTKDSTFMVLVPPDVSHTETLKMPLKDIGTGLVENLNLLSQFSTAVTSISGWWMFVKEDLEAEVSVLFPNTPGIIDTASVANFAMWSDIKDAYQQYYDAISSAQVKYPTLLKSSTEAWKSVAVANARSANASTVQHETLALPGESTTVDQASRMSRSSRIWSLFDSVRKARKRRSSKRKKNAKRDGNIVEEKDGEKAPADTAEAPAINDIEAPPVAPALTNTAARRSPSFSGLALYRPASSRTSSATTTTTSSSSIYSRSRSPGTPPAPLSRVQSTSQHSAATNVTTGRPGKIKRMFSCCAGDFFDVSLGHLGQYGRSAKKDENPLAGPERHGTRLPEDAVSQ